jgi:hypothetical protein
MSEQGKEVLDGDKKEDWMNAKWRPMMGWMYMMVCTMDFVVFPVLWGLLQTMGGGRVETQWMPITLQGAGLFHMAMGAIIGVAAFGRTQEKLAGATHTGTAVGAPSFNQAPQPSFNNAPLGGNTMSTAPAFGSRSVTNTPAFGTAPVQPAHPEI